MYSELHLDAGLESGVRSDGFVFEPGAHGFCVKAFDQDAPEVTA